MKRLTQISLSLLIPLLIPGILRAGYVYQGSWIGGPGVPGPVVGYWNVFFDTQSNLEWSLVTGKLFMDMSVTPRPICGDFPGCNYAFPADMDGDGDMDVLSSQAQTAGLCGVVWFENDGNGTGWDTHYVSGDYHIRCAYPGDLDNDGDMDVVGVHTNVAFGRIYWWRNDDGIGDSWTRFTIDEDFGSPKYLCFSDINGDGILDVVSSSDSGLHQIAWWESSTTPPDSVWEKHLVSASVLDGEELFTVDLDQDGDIDILCACPNYASTVAVQLWRNDDGLGTEWSFIEVNDHPEGAQSVHAANIDSDTDIDVIYCEAWQPPGFVKGFWCENLDISGTDWEEHEISTTLDAPWGVHAADVTDDGYVDVIVGDVEGFKSYLYRNMDGEGSEWATYLLASIGFYDIDVSDFNDDGHTDILAAGWSKIYWFELSSYPSGWLESSILDVTGYPQWDSIAWTAEEPAGTDLFFQIKSSNDWKNMGVWCDTIFEPGSLAGYIDSTHRYIQYRVGMTTETRFGTPVLDEVRFYWSSMGIEGGSGGEEFVITAVPNPSAGGVSIVVPSLYAEDVELFVYDISGKIVRIVSERNGN
ncbi:MAG: FG-GAP-like repeat-containing protein, partial [Candidatus Fermentibacteria bacterium]